MLPIIMHVNPNPPVECADWNAVINWVKNLTKATAGISHVACLFMKKFYGGKAELLYKLYYKDDDHYVEAVRTGFVPIAELPDRLKANFDFGEEIDITDEIESELHLTL